MATYKIIGKRFLRKYTAGNLTPVYQAATDAARIVAELCNVPWEASSVMQAELPPHGDEENPSRRERFDAALFCANHADGKHRAYANAAVYRYTMPDNAVGQTLLTLAATVTGDPYNAGGCRLHIFTNPTGEIPTSCAEVRGNGEGGEPLADGSTASAVAPRTAKTVKATDYWYPATETATLAPAGGLVLQKYLFLAVALESYSTVRGNWLEGSSYVDNLVAMETSGPVTGWSDGGTYDLSGGELRTFNVVAGGAMAALPAGDCGVRALTVQRTGDDFEIDVSADTDVPAKALYARARVPGIRTLDLSGGDSAAAFATPLFSGEARNVNVCPAFKDVAATARYSTVTGDFAGGTFEDLHGMYVVRTSGTGGANETLLASNTLASVASGSNAANLASLKASIAKYGGLSGALYKYSGTSSKTAAIYVFAKERIANDSSGYLGDGALGVLMSGDSASKAYAYPVTWTNQGGGIIPTFFWGPNGTDSNANLKPFYFVHDAEAKTISYPTAHSGSAWSVSYVGTLTAIRPIVGSTCYKFILSGDLESVGGAACSNFAIVEFSFDGTFAVTVPGCDSLITPDSYRNFAVSMPLVNAEEPDNEFYVTGGFTTLGGVACEIAAHVQDSIVTPISLPAGTRPPEYFLMCDAAGETAGTAAFWVDAHVEDGDMDSYAAPDEAVTDAQAAFGLRRLYADLYGGAVPASAVRSEGDARPGAAFTVRGDNIDIPTADGIVSAQCWNLSAAVLVVPFSCPLDFAASKLRLDWPAVAATDGSKVNVWLKRGKYLKAYPSSYPKALFTGETPKVDGWELVGMVEPEDGVDGTATLDIDPIEDDTATLMFVAFVGQDDFNPGDGMALPRGIGSINVNAVSRTASGLDAGFRPNITLLG